MLLKNNISNIKREKRLINIEHENANVTTNSCTLTFTTPTPHGLRNGDQVFLSHNINKFESWDELAHFLTNNQIAYLTKAQTITVKNVKQEDIEVDYEEGYYINENRKIVPVPNARINNVLSKFRSFNNQIYVSVVDNKTFQIFLPRYSKIYVASVTDTIDGGIFRVKGNLPLLLCAGDKFYMRHKIYSYQFNRTAEVGDEYQIVEVLPQNTSEYLGSNFVMFNGNVYEWVCDIELIQCTYINESTFSYSYDDGLINANDTLEIEDGRFIDYANQQLHQNVNIYEVKEYLNFTISPSSNINIDLNNDDITKNYFDAKKNELIPDIIDYEKRCFTPYHKSGKTLNAVRQINFNLFLRDRNGSDDWNTHDGAGWNQYPINDDGNFVKQNNVTNGDLLTFVGFTDEDIYYRKKKVEKTFLRLSFYDSRNPITQFLLFYSTVFLDSGDLYTKYIKNLSTLTVPQNVPMVASNQFGENNLTLSFSVNDRYSYNKSSEGFYLYLFPDGIYDGAKRTIYMKAEFNNAATGKTVPLIYPRTTRQLTFDSKDFPKSLLNDDGDMSKLYEYMYIPVVVTYDASKNDFIYYFDAPINDFNNNTQEITLGLYEPKLNPIQ